MDFSALLMLSNKNRSDIVDRNLNQYFYLISYINNFYRVNVVEQDMLDKK